MSESMVAQLVKDVDKSLDFLNEVLALKSRVDGVDRPQVCKFFPDDAFHLQASMAALLLLHFKQLAPLIDRLDALGRQMHEDQKIEVDVGQKFYMVVLAKLLDEQEKQSNPPHDAGGGA